MTKKTEQQFGNDELMGSMFATKEDQEKPQTTSNDGAAVKSNTSAKLNNHSVKEVNTTVETRSQRRPFLLCEEIYRNLKLWALGKGLSGTEMINATMTRYVKRVMRKPEVKNMMLQLDKMHRHN